MKNPIANKALGQHYLKDKNVIQNILADEPAEYDLIVEIGPGPATLTKGLSEKGKKVFLIEMDDRFIPQLESLDNVQNIFLEDALNFNWESFCKEHPGKIWLVSNLPYNISSQLFISFLSVPNITKMTLMYQKEVGEKTYERAHTKNQMNSLLSLSLAYTKPALLMKVAPGAFNPPPKVDSVVVSYDVLEEPILTRDEFKDFERFIRLLFSQKRKQLGRVLKGESQIIEKLKELEFDLTRRAETLDFSEVIKIYRLS